ncbi:HAD family hydrolase [Haloferax mediterranei ATCC 33500]|uniref:HAD family hydrolase n=1 Tax=Haloferax mediterranei (strain ATCC 33500 / DSM 1411 / JCM 8866 / NBRC 14739 / NCIMB 2177 / R-4) TaxID=523841 RepID=I3R8F2_HALMT|nr:HAD family hydrolase [Haloferax mediterranei]AFK20512.1 putative haloacid dehalogenase-like hydrolase [Haloferax mediterranei ATCC 33500]AHZ23871.1 haloacid dehalogenase [Haloferax mediterranei ATCC 33500]ELZ98295.1 putative haloacid dehalogenase-like hydrolase [Haloferax mediterranei ATCC 33500]MDX5986732.1 HAD family hydrolase [Haloferax mediterranei ATCC 33500]QCQ76056.1 HAD family hydrolase [Haloferax mediterranei ATCC 33500]
MTTAVFFDLDLTLLQYTTDFESIFERAVPDAPDGAYERYVSVLLDSFDQLSTDPYYEGFGAVVSEFDVDADPETLTTRHAEAELAATTVPESAHEALVRTASDRPTGILTNGTLEMQRAKLERHDLEAVVDAVVVSNDPDVAARKPDTGIFHAAEASLPADDYVYVGDTYDEDIVGARQAGWDAIHVGTDGPDDDPARVDSVDEAVARILD